MRLKIVILMMLAATSAAMGQEELPDSIPAPGLRGSYAAGDSADIYLKFDKLYSELSQTAFINEFKADSVDLTLPEIDINFTPGVAQIAGWRGGRIYAAGGVDLMPGLMAINSGSINVEQSFGNLSVSAFGSVTKYGFFGGMEKSYGVGGAVSYRFSNRLSATVFGEYHTAAGLNQRAMMGYANATRFGGFIDYSISDKFGVEVGAQGYRSMLNRRIEAMPIVKPYYRVSKNAKIGVDVGGILYQLLRSRQSDYNSRNPTIGPPVQKLSQTMGY